MESAVIKNWDNKTWISSKKYISLLNSLLIKSNKLNINSKIIDIGCGRGRIIGTLSSKLNLKYKPIGIDLVNHKDKDKRIDFKKIDALSFFSTNKRKFDLILIKQTIHLLKLSDINTLLIQLKKHLSPKGKIIIFMISPYKNELPQFSLMKKKFLKSLKYQKKISKLISKIYPQRTLKNFTYKVNITKKKYMNMISNRYMSTLLDLNYSQILEGINEINLKYKKTLKFKDKLICIIIKNK